jgi:predicted DNA binding CopG/RHH family protein
MTVSLSIRLPEEDLETLKHLAADLRVPHTVLARLILGLALDAMTTGKDMVVPSMIQK